MRIDERPFDKVLSTIVWKVTETCNMACPYCFMFSSKDKSYRNKPKRVSAKTIDSVVSRINEYVIEHEISFLDITLHGGEPLLLGKQSMKYLLVKLSSIKNISINIQTNATLLDEEYIEIFLDNNVNISISLDGYPEIQNKSKLKTGQESYSAIINGLKLLVDSKYDIFKGVLCVIDLNASPLRVYEHMLDLGIHSMDFLLPLRNHKTPLGYSIEQDDYYRWLKQIFDKYLYDDNELLSIRILDSIIDLLIGSNEPMCSIRHSAVDMLTIDTDGSIQLIDDLRICGNNFVELGLTTFSDRLDSFFSHSKVLNLYKHEQRLPEKCTRCHYLNICGSGGHAFRYNGDNSFDMPSIYCTDTYKVIEHIEDSIYG